MGGALGKVLGEGRSDRNDDGNQPFAGAWCRFGMCTELRGPTRAAVEIRQAERLVPLAQSGAEVGRREDLEGAGCWWR